METKPLKFFTSSSSIETDWTCGMKYWWSKLEGGSGIVPINEAQYFVEGRQLHADLEPFAGGSKVQDVVGMIPPLSGDVNQIDLEHHARRVGWVAAFGLYVEPFLRSFGTEVACEQEISLNRDPLWVSSRPDRIQRRKESGRLVYREWKAMSSTRREWVEHWKYAIQLHIGLAAIEETYNEPTEYGQVLGLYKGTERDGRLLHPYVWAYFKDGEWDHKYHPGWEHRPVWEYPGGVLEWVERCGKEAADQQFVWSAPVGLDRRLLEAVVRSRSYRMAIIQEAKEKAQGDLALRERVFDPRISQCRPAYGSACPFLAACHDLSVNQDPLKSGLYIKREFQSRTESEG